MTNQQYPCEPLYLVGKYNGLTYGFLGDLDKPILSKSAGEALLCWMEVLEDETVSYSLVPKSFLVEQFNKENLYIGAFTKSTQERIISWLTTATTTN